jgi:quercetin dioxygenase-like cupin family protein
MDLRPVRPPRVTRSIARPDTFGCDIGHIEGDDMTTYSHGSSARPPRPLSAGLVLVDVAEVLTTLRGETAFRSDGRDSETVVADGPARVIVSVVDPGREVGGSTSDGYVSIYLLEGGGRIVRDGVETELSAGSLAVLAPGAAWKLRAHSESAFVASFWRPS